MILKVFKRHWRLYELKFSFKTGYSFSKAFDENLSLLVALTAVLVCIVKYQKGDSLTCFSKDSSIDKYQRELIDF